MPDGNMSDDNYKNNLVIHTVNDINNERLDLSLKQSTNLRYLY